MDLVIVQIRVGLHVVSLYGNVLELCGVYGWIRQALMALKYLIINFEGQSVDLLTNLRYWRIGQNTYMVSSALSVAIYWML